MYAREIAKLCPGSVRQVITLATPFGSLGGGNHAGTIYKMLKRDTPRLTPQIEARLRECPPVPTPNRLAQPEGKWRPLRRSERLGSSPQ